jgi:hypothetical protein
VEARIPKSATGGTSLSMHVFGLAVDLNYEGNPFVGNASKGVFGVAMRATSLVDGGRSTFARSSARPVPRTTSSAPSPAR